VAGLVVAQSARTLGYQLNRVTIFAPPGVYEVGLDYDAGLFAQDRRTMNRLTLTGALRLDLQKESADPTTIGPTRYLPNRPTRPSRVRTSPTGRTSTRGSARLTICSATVRRR
jgi:hypothetical protein